MTRRIALAKMLEHRSGTFLSSATARALVRGLDPRLVLLAEVFGGTDNATGVWHSDGPAALSWAARQHIDDGVNRDANGPEHFSGRKVPDAYQFRVDGDLEIEVACSAQLNDPDPQVVSQFEYLRLTLLPAEPMSAACFVDLCERVRVDVPTNPPVMTAP